MKTLAVLTLAVLALSCASHTLGIKVGDQVATVTYKSGQTILLEAIVKEINGSLVMVSNPAVGTTTIDFDSVAAWQRKNPQP